METFRGPLSQIVGSWQRGTEQGAWAIDSSCISEGSSANERQDADAWKIFCLYTNPPTGKAARCRARECARELFHVKRLDSAPQHADE
jgi:hypothetical protein